jgi:hypothetical protein
VLVLPPRFDVAAAAVVVAPAGLHVNVDQRRWLPFAALVQSTHACVNGKTRRWDAHDSSKSSRGHARTILSSILSIEAVTVVSSETCPDLALPPLCVMRILEVKMTLTT